LTGPRQPTIRPKVNGNPERQEQHTLRQHSRAERPDAPRDYDALAKYVAKYLAKYLAEFDGEGVVWHHPDGRMAKLKRRDFQRWAGCRDV
jgi:hypothetical protein